jgi:Glycosyltransferase 61
MPSLKSVLRWPRPRYSICCAILCLVAIVSSVADGHFNKEAGGVNCKNGSPLCRDLRQSKQNVKLQRGRRNLTKRSQERGTLETHDITKDNLSTGDLPIASRFTEIAATENTAPTLLRTRPTSRQLSVEGYADLGANASSKTSNSIETLSEANTTSFYLIHLKDFPVDKPVCRIEGVCRSGDGEYLLPHWMKAYAGHIEECGIQGNIQYVLYDTEKKPVQSQISEGRMETQPDKVWTIKGLLTSKMSLSEDFSSFDMIGGKAPRELMQWMVTDLTPSLLTMDLLARFHDYQLKDKIAAYKCVKDDGSVCRQQSAFPDLKPLLLVDVRISEQKSHQWPQGFLRLIRNGFAGELQVSDAHDVYGWHLRSRAACFKSLVSTSARLPDFPMNAFDSAHILWHENKLSRATVNVDSETERQSASPLKCTRRVLLLNKYGKRYMIGHDKLRSAIEATAKGRASEKYPSIRILAETVFFENSSFHEQVSVMQESDVVVSSHGSSIANVIFLRPETTLIEILPFSLGTDTYSNLARVFGVNYKMVMAQPDEEVFVSCVKHFNPGMPAEISQRTADWSSHAEKFRQDATASHLNPTTSFRIADSEDIGAEAGHLRECATYQRLTFNIDHVAKMVVAAAIAQCGVRDALQAV